MERIAVEKDLTSIKKDLQKQGYQVDVLSTVQMKESNPTDYDVMVISGTEQDRVALQALVQNCPVINAAGLTPKEVSNQVAQTVQRY